MATLMAFGSRALLFVAVAVVSATLLSALLPAQVATEDRLLYREWWPRHSSATADEYSGAAECAKCHSGKAATQTSTPMARTALSVAASDILEERARLAFAVGPLSYQIESAAGKSILTVSEGRQSLTASLKWAFGDGHVGQSYLFERDGNVYESRASYFDGIKGLDFTPGRKLADPPNLQQAMSREVKGDELVRCFSCHATASTIAGKLDRATTTPGIACEACHGPGRKHVVAEKLAAAEGQAMESDSKSTLIFDPARLKPADSVDFCGSCHGTWWDVKMAPPVGVANVRSQPYRLEKSRCWGKTGDARLTCVACHDPHEKLVRETAAYDKNCLSCHIADRDMKPSTDHPGPACKVSTKDCASCHMPKYELADFHYRFTDHDIRVVRPDAPYPE